MEYVSLLLTNSPYSISIVSLLLHVARIFVFLIVIAKMFQVKLYELFPLSLIGKIIIPSFVILYAERILLNYCHIESPFLVLSISLIVYVIVYCVYSVIAKLDYLSIVKPLISRE